MMAAPDLVELFKTSVPEGFLEALARRVPWVYKAAFKRCGKLPPEQAHNLRPFYRWCLLDEQLAALARRCGIVPKIQLNDGSCYFVQVPSGRIVLTACSVEKPWRVPRKAIFRETLA